MAIASVVSPGRTIASVFIMPPVYDESYYGEVIHEIREMQIMNMLIKQRRESAEMFRKGDRIELAEKERQDLLST